jgi:hypothetical protein
MSARPVLFRVVALLVIVAALVVAAHYAGGGFMDTLRRMHGRH